MKAATKKTEKAGGNDLQTLSALAKELKTTQAALREVVKDAGIQPNAVRRGCAYYGPKARSVIKKHVTA